MTVKQRIFEVQLIGLFGNVVYSSKISAEDKSHAVRIASAIYNQCWKEARTVELPEPVCW